MMRQIRACFFYIGLAILVVIFTPLSLLPIPYHYRYGWSIKNWSRSVLWWLRVCCGVSYQVTGLNHIPQKGGVILACKHQSAWETFALIAILPTPISFVYKKELIYLPLFGQVLWTLRMIPIDRSQGSKAFKSVCEKGQSYLDQGQVVLMFPEGTRTAVGSPPNYKNGVGRLSIAVQRPIIPIALNSGLYWPKKGFSKNSGIIRVVVGSPITPPLSNTPDDMYRLMSQVKENIENAFSSTPVTKNES